MEYMILFTAQFFVVFALVMNSKFIRDDRWVLAMINSWFISGSQFASIYFVANNTSGIGVLIAGAAGASLGVASSHLFYTRFLFKEK